MTPEEQKSMDMKYAKLAGETHWEKQLELREANLIAKSIPKATVRLLLSPAFERRPIVVKAERWLQDQRRFLLIMGDSYRGKSVAADSVFLEHTFRYSWFVAPDTPVVENRSWAYGKHVTAAAYCSASKSWTEKTWMDEIKRTHLLVVDDLGTELQDMKAAFTDLISYRTGAWTPESKMYPTAPLRTIMTTNLPIDAFAKLYGERVLNRLRAEGDIESV